MAEETIIETSNLEVHVVTETGDQEVQVVSEISEEIFLVEVGAVQGPAGPQGLKGDRGDPAPPYIGEELPDFTLLFDNKLI